ncbi:PadR family transcriptional regulator [Methylobacterium sp. Leaf91]|uniref:PadR family transcriptional regulator n=1 Tax=Methylobacterium sp. Leaf91 TaxID=1736247 RepID=UPI0007003F5A|nr:PadR family transcriptional regulator [Methylobacterium sp. Leaf91]KQO99086.1 hypothetical protein ASF32_14625 [Methylobacterium sp. Leaf91]
MTVAEIQPAVAPRVANALSRKEAAILSVLTREFTSEGAGNRIGERSGIGTGSLYPALARLEIARLIHSKWGVAASPGGPRPRLYALTEEGAQRLADVPLNQREYTPPLWVKLGRWLFFRPERR